MPNTPTYSWPYQALGDAPNGAALGHDLALAIEATMATANAAIAAAQAALTALPILNHWTTWATTTAGLTVGGGSITSKWRDNGQSFDYRFIFTLGAGSGISGPTFTMPATPHGDYVNGSYAGVPVGKVYLFDSGTGAWVGQALCLSGNVCTPTYEAETGAGTVTSITGGAPFGWASGDKLIVVGNGIEKA